MTEFVDNDVYKFRLSIYLDEPDIIVYTKPCKPSRNWKNIHRKDYGEICENHEKLVQEKYFTKKRVEEIKKDICKKIMSGEIPIDITLQDTDSGYNVTEDMLFDLENG